MKNRYCVMTTDDWGYGRETFREYFENLEDAKARAEKILAEPNPPKVEVVDELLEAVNELRRVVKRLAE